MHITDFGLSKDEVVDPRGATTFCGTPEYLAPEMLINRKSREGYGKAVDWWSLGTLIFEMLTGWPPFYDKNLRKMCEQILRSELVFPAACAASPEARDLIRALLQRDPAHRLGSGAGGAADIRAHPFFRDLDWAQIEARAVAPPFVPKADGGGSGGGGGGGEGEGEADIANFDTTFTSEPAVLTPPLQSELKDVANADFSDFGFVNTTNLPSHIVEAARAPGAGSREAARADEPPGELAGFDGRVPGATRDEGDEEGGGGAGSEAPAGGAGGLGAGGAEAEARPERPPLDAESELDLSAHLKRLALSEPSLASLAEPDGGGGGA